MYSNTIWVYELLNFSKRILYFLQGDPCSFSDVVEGQSTFNQDVIQYSQIELRKVSREDTGIYRCVAINHGGLTSESTIDITLKGI